uniref:Guanine nucleotide-binding protein subunit beta-like protein n=1 Tax=Eutreptiella gymnastica TaxID=73025 RepID=A0A7S1N3B3_9EUGL
MCFADEATKQIIVAQADGNLTKLTLASNGGLVSSNVARNFTVPTSGGMFIDRSAGTPRIFSLSVDGHLEVRNLEKGEKEERSKYVLAGPISGCAYQNGRLAFGGLENDLKVWDAAAERIMWKAKNVETDFLDMKVPIWCAATCFLRPDSQNEIAVGTGYHQLRVYDLRQGQRRPVINFNLQEKEGRCTTIAKHHVFFEHEVMLGDTLGNVYCVDYRKGVTTGRLHPSNPGSVRALAFHSSQPCVASSGLGRKLYLHDARTRKLITKAYLKHKCTALVFSKEPCFVEKYQIGADGKVYDDVWDYLNNTKKKKKKQLPQQDLKDQQELQPTDDKNQVSKPATPANAAGQAAVKKKKKPTTMTTEKLTVAAEERQVTLDPQLQPPRKKQRRLEQVE